MYIPCPATDKENIEIIQSAFLCCNLFDRCICWANFDGFSAWILNQKHFFPPIPCYDSLSCLPCLLPSTAIIHWQSGIRRKHFCGFLSEPHGEALWWMRASYAGVYTHFISDELGICCRSFSLLALSWICFDTLWFLFIYVFPTLYSFKSKHPLSSTFTAVNLCCLLPPFCA